MVRTFYHHQIWECLCFVIRECLLIGLIWSSSVHTDERVCTIAFLLESNKWHLLCGYPCVFAWKDAICDKFLCSKDLLEPIIVQSRSTHFVSLWLRCYVLLPCYLLHPWSYPISEEIAVLACLLKHVAFCITQIRIYPP